MFYKNKRSKCMIINFKIKVLCKEKSKNQKNNQAKISSINTITNYFTINTFWC